MWKLSKQIRDGLFFGVTGVLCGLLLMTLPRTAVGQSLQLLAGSFAGTIKAITVTTDGYLNVAIQGGSAAFTSWTTSAANTASLNNLIATPGASTPGTVQAVTVQNSTASVVGVPAQWSPGVGFTAHGWDVDDAVDRNVKCFWTLQPVSGNTVTSQLKLQCDASPFTGGGFVSPLVINNGGQLTILGALVAGQTTSIGFQGRSLSLSPADQEWNFTNNSATINAGLRSARVVEANTGSKSPSALENGEIYTNTGDGDGSSVTLLNDPTVGSTVTVAVTAAFTITITASAGETLYYGATACGTSLTSNIVGSTATFVAVTGGSGAIWVTTASLGTFVCTP